jgi:hypothetical protein
VLVVASGSVAIFMYRLCKLENRAVRFKRHLQRVETTIEESRKKEEGLRKRFLSDNINFSGLTS